MNYEFRRTRYELTQEEQEKARFILKTIGEWQRAQALHWTGPIDIEVQAFEKFKTQFYRNLVKRLGIDCEITPNGVSMPIGMTIIENGQRMEHCEVNHID